MNYALDFWPIYFLKMRGRAAIRPEEKRAESTPREMTPEKLHVNSK